MPPRAVHTKRRDGCARCKQRRVRCDKKAPTCSNCTRRAEVCEYQTWKLVNPTNANTSTITTTYLPVLITPINNEPSDRILNGLFASTSLQDKLDVHTPLSPSATEEVQLWRAAVRSNTSSHPYLKLCFTSIYQLFAKRTGPDVTQEEQSCAYRDQIAASNIFRASHFTIDETNWISVLIFSLSLVIFQFASQQATVEDIDYMETMYVLKMSAAVGSEVAPFLWRSRIWPFIQLRNEQASSQPMDPKLPAALRGLQSTIASSTTNEPSTKVVMSATVQVLIIWSNMCNGCPHAYRQYVMFPGMVSDEYLQLLAGGDDLALLVLIYWCAIMYAGTRRWFLDRWLPRTAKMARGQLKGDWSDVLEWPNAVMNGT
ncbi:hypothetical protein DE146DRAFT_164536 [Phaeosphaeria sp. MPI-PUGE-AT-0046c]|nr:hypothetical protein DE146DRAFT_164536 [Phaeosphaeria sp. MPI-PUGE-AT-0046c]